MKKISHQLGISLVEMAVVLVVIGVIIGAVFKGADLLHNAKKQSTVAQIQQLLSNVQLFKEKYSFLPGDFPKASSDINESIPNGTGSGTLAGDPFSKSSPAGLFWVHLEAAELFHTAMPSGETLMYGDGLLPSELGGGFTVVYSPTPEMPGHWLVLGGKNGNSGEEPTLTPEEASYINKKLDNGSPLTGKVKSLDGNRATSGKCLADGHYNLKNKEKSCVMYIWFAP